MDEMAIRKETTEGKHTAYRLLNGCWQFSENSVLPARKHSNQVLAGLGCTRDHMVPAEHFKQAAVQL